MPKKCSHMYQENEWIDDSPQAETAGSATYDNNFHIMLWEDWDDTKVKFYLA